MRQLFDRDVEGKTEEELVQMSKEKWRDIAYYNGEDIGGANCALCKRYIGNSCKDCPVMKRTGLSSCASTPYKNFRAHASSHDENHGHAVKAQCPRCRALAEEEIKFLDSLLPKKEKTTIEYGETVTKQEYAPIEPTPKRVILIKDYDYAKTGMKGTILGKGKSFERALIQFDESFPGGHEGHFEVDLWGRPGYCHFIPFTTEYLEVLGENDKRISPELKVAGHTVSDITSETFKVGCETVSWKSLDELLKRRPK